MIEAIIRLAEKAAKEPWELAQDEDRERAIQGKLRELIGKDLEAAYKLTDKAERAERDQRRPRQGAAKASPTRERRSRRPYLGRSSW